MKLRRLGWAGIEIEHDEHVVVVDLLENPVPLSPELALDLPLPPPSRPGGVDAGLVSHLHADHTDAAALSRALTPGAPVHGPEPQAGPPTEGLLTAGVEAALREHGLRYEPVQLWETRTVGPFRVTACPAIDGLGDPQVSWVIEAGGTRVFHGGDTMLHGFWWSIVRRLGPIDVAFLPINGPTLVDVPTLSPDSPLPAVLLPEQAAVVAHLLGSRTAVPIHYGLDRPPLYAEAPHAVDRFARATRDLGICAAVLEPGEHLAVSEADG